MVSESEESCQGVGNRERCQGKIFHRVEFSGDESIEVQCHGLHHPRDNESCNQSESGVSEDDSLNDCRT